MADIVDKATRSRMMAGIKGRDTRPEMTVRRALHAAGFRYRLHVHDLPGRPDIVLPKHRAAILIHGCFWHRHQGCRFATSPATRPDFWANKFAQNVARDAHNEQALRVLGWRVAVLWECDLRNPRETWIESITSWIGSSQQHYEPPQQMASA